MDPTASPIFTICEDRQGTLWLAPPHDFSAPACPDIYQRFNPVTTSNQTYEFNTQKPGDGVRTRIARGDAKINTVLADLQAGIYGDSRAEILNLASE